MNEPIKTGDASGAATLREELAENHHMLGRRLLAIPSILGEMSAGKKTFYPASKE